jgi:DNA-binding transcriptional ArsR family regulator
VIRARTPQRFASAAPVFAALGDATRLSLVQLTEGGEVTRQAVTKHLKALAGAGLVRSRRQGRERIWSLQPARLLEARHHLDLISSQWDAAIERLRAFVE